MTKRKRHYEVRPFETHHYKMLIDDPKAEFGLRNITLDFDKIANNFAGNGNYGRSGFCDGELLITAGIMSPWPHYGAAWALLSGNAHKHPFFVHRAVVEGLDYFILKFDLRRVEANVCAALPQAIAWALALGFKWESDMLKYGPHGETFKKYVILR